MKLIFSILLIISTSLFGCNNNTSVKKVEVKNPSINIELTRIKAK